MFPADNSHKKLLARAGFSFSSEFESRKDVRERETWCQKIAGGGFRQMRDEIGDDEKKNAKTMWDSVLSTVSLVS